jgi:hypothetical protein
MWDAPIVAEVHRTRETLAAEYQFDIAAFFADLRKRQTALGERLVLEKKRPEPKTEVEQGRPSIPPGLISPEAAAAAQS